MKKYLSLLLSLTIIFTIASTLCVQAQTEEVNYTYNSLNALKNHDFEENIDSWEISSKDAEYTAVKSDAEAYSGKNSLYMSAKKEIFANQSIPVSEGDKLIAIAYINAEKPLSSNSYFLLSVETYGEEQTGSKKRYLGPSPGTWRQMTVELDVPANTTRADLKIGMDGGGSAYIDNVVLMHFPKDRSWKYTKEERAAFKKNDCTIKTDQLFYYTEWEGGYADITPSASILQNYADGSLKAYITKKDGTKLAEKTFSVKSVTLEFKTADLKPSYGEAFIVHADVYNKEGVLVSESKHQIMYYDRPTHIDENANWIKEDGTPLDVIMGIGHTKDFQMDYSASTGMTVVNVGFTLDSKVILEELDMAWERGLYAVVALFSNSNPCGNYPVKLIDAINAIKDHPAVFAYSVQDEPAADYFDTVYALQNSYQLIRDIDRNHPVFIVESNINFRNVGTYETTCCDFYAVDTYPADRSVYSSYVGPFSKALAKYQKQNHNKPVAMYTQNFDWKGFYPTGNQSRHMFYQVLFSGVRFPAYYTESGKLMSSEDMAKGIAHFGSQDLPILYDLFSKDKYEILAYDISGNDNLWSYDSSLAWYYVFREGNDTYIAAINLSDTDEKQVIIPNIEGIKGRPISIGDTSGSSISVNGSNITLNLAGGACVMYKYTKDSHFTLLNSYGYKVGTPLGFGETVAKYIPKEGESSKPRIIIATYSIENGAEVLEKVSITDALPDDEGIYKAVANIAKEAMGEKYKISAFVFEKNTLKPLDTAIVVEN